MSATSLNDLPMHLYPFFNGFLWWPYTRTSGHAFFVFLLDIALAQRSRLAVDSGPLQVAGNARPLMPAVPVACMYWPFK